MDRASASGSVRSGFDCKSSQSNELEIGIRSFPTRHSAIKLSIVLSKPSSSLVVPLGMTLNGILPSKCGGQMAGNS